MTMRSENVACPTTTIEVPGSILLVHVLSRASPLFARTAFNSAKSPEIRGKFRHHGFLRGLLA